jgi:chromosome partitioning protein
VFHELTKAGIPKDCMVFALNHVLSETEEREGREYLQEAGYSVLEGYLPSQTGYRAAQNSGRSITETRFASLNKKADQLIQALIDRIKNG